jgi:hypothetical protein
MGTLLLLLLLRGLQELRMGPINISNSLADSILLLAMVNLSLIPTNTVANISNSNMGNTPSSTISSMASSTTLSNILSSTVSNTASSMVSNTRSLIRNNNTSSLTNSRPTQLAGCTQPTPILLKTITIHIPRSRSLRAPHTSNPPNQTPQPRLHPRQDLSSCTLTLPIPQTSYPQSTQKTERLSLAFPILPREVIARGVMVGSSGVFVQPNHRRF